MMGIGRELAILDDEISRTGWVQESSDRESATFDTRQNYRHTQSWRSGHGASKSYQQVRLLITYVMPKGHKFVSIEKNQVEPNKLLLLSFPLR